MTTEGTPENWELEQVDASFSNKESPRPIVVSCIRPTSAIHIGNYFGALRNWVNLQDHYQCIFGIADLHSLSLLSNDPINAQNDAAAQRQYTHRMVIDLLAIGIDPKKCTLFIQSLVPEHTELYWLFSCLCPYKKLQKMPLWEKSQGMNASQQIISSTLLTYPVLQASDILAYRAAYVPVGRDQERNVEVARTIASHFNRNYLSLFPLPEILPRPTLQINALTDPSKIMSKGMSEWDWIGVFEDDDTIDQKIRWAMTEREDHWQHGKMQPGVTNLLKILDACGNAEAADAFRQEYQAGVHKFDALKGEVARSLKQLSSGMRARREELAAEADSIWRQVEEMSEYARSLARETLIEVRAAFGLPMRRR